MNTVFLMYSRFSRFGSNGKGCLLLLLLFSIALLPSVFAQRTIRDIVGVDVSFNQGESMDHLPILHHDLGIKWVRTEQTWGLEKDFYGVYRFPDEVMARFEWWRDNDINVLFMLHYNKIVEGDGGTYGEEYFANYAIEVVKILDSIGVNFVLELFNEPDISWVQEQFGGDQTGADNAPWVDAYMAMCNAVISRINQWNPNHNIKFLITAAKAIPHYWYMEEANFPVDDIAGLAFHPYNWYSVDHPEWSNGGPEMYKYTASSFPPFAPTCDDQRRYKSVVEKLRDHATNKLGKTPEIWITEDGYPVEEGAYWRYGPNPEDVELESTEKQQAAWLPRMYLTFIAAGCEQVFWWCTDIGDPDRLPQFEKFGLWRGDGTRRPSFYALKNFLDQFGDYYIDKVLIDSMDPDFRTTSEYSDPDETVQAYLLADGAGNYKIAVWSFFVDGHSVILEKDSSEPIEITDIYGYPVNVSDPNAERIELKVNLEPIYISGVGPDAKLTVNGKLYIAPPVTDGLRVWTDAQDASTLDLDAFNGAWAWNDKANGAGYGDSNNDKWWTPSAPNLPRYVSNAWGAGQNVLRFDGVDDGMNNSFLGNLGIDDVTGGFTIFVVARNMDTVAYAPVLSSYYDWKYNISMDNDSGVVLRAHEGAVDYNDSVDSAVSTSTRIRAISYDNKTVEAIENGSSLGPGTWDAVPPDTASFGTNATMRLGYQAYAEQHGAVEVGEVLIYDRQLTAGEQNEVGYYLEQKWGLDTAYTIPPIPPVSPSVVDFKLLSSNDVMKVVVHVSGESSLCAPRATTNLVDGSWADVPHSTNGVDGFVVTNLDYSTPDVIGINNVIYLKADERAKFFKFKME